MKIIEKVYNKKILYALIVRSGYKKKVELVFLLTRMPLNNLVI